MVSLKQLRYADAVAKSGHFGQAAERCAITQPALSMQVQLLENELGMQIFERLPSGVRPTADGDAVIERGRRILAELQDLTDFARWRQTPLTGALKLGVIPTIAPYLLPQMIGKLRQSRPGLNLHIRESQTATLLGQLEEGKLDVLLLALPVPQEGLNSLSLFDDPFVLVCPQSSTIDQALDRQPESLGGEHLLLLEEGHCLRDQTIAYLQQHNIDRIDTFGASSLSTIVQLVASGMGSTLLPKLAIPHETGHRQLKLVDFPEPKPSRQIGLVWRKTSAQQTDFMALGELISRLVADR